MNRTELEKWGWNEGWERALAAAAAGSASVEPCRVVTMFRGGYGVRGIRGEMKALLRSAATHQKEPTALPAVGDWVLVEPQADGTRTIEVVLPRVSQFVRKAAGRRSRDQVVAANIDTVFVVTSLNSDLNPRRLERYLATIWEGGAVPVIVLTKLDLCENLPDALRLVESAAPGVAVVALSATTGEGVERLDPFLETGRTVALLGSSGVGKSTLLNRLAGKEIMKTGAIRESDERGRHVTTQRQMVQLPSGVLLIDTPGMRELHLADVNGGLDTAFSELEEFARECRFADCAHQSEPGCAVLQAVADGMLASERLESYRALQAEIAAYRRRSDERAARERKNYERSISISIRRFYRDRGGR